VPIIVAVLAWLTGGSNRLTVTRWAGLLAGLAGVALLAGARCRRRVTIRPQAPSTA